MDKIARSYLRQHVLVSVGDRDRKGKMINERITQKLEFVETQAQKKSVLTRVLANNDPPFIVFCNEKKTCDGVAKMINDGGQHFATCIHGSYEQSKRRDNLNKFKEGEFDVLVGTDVVGRGIDIPGKPLFLCDCTALHRSYLAFMCLVLWDTPSDVNTVIQWDLPNADNMDKYSHRIGRTGRAGKDGTAVSIVAPEDGPILEQLKEILTVSLALFFSTFTLSFKHQT